MSHRFNIKNLREAAREVGDLSDYAIAKRTGISTSTMSRLANGDCQPNAGTQSRILRTYHRLPFSKLMTISGDTDTDQVAA